VCITACGRTRGWGAHPTARAAATTVAGADAGADTGATTGAGADTGAGAGSDGAPVIGSDGALPPEAGPGRPSSLAGDCGCQAGVGGVGAPAGRATSPLALAAALLVILGPRRRARRRR
jgi:hypothetical protein